MSGMLYYPTINPSSTVLTQAVVHWDFISTLVPPESDPDPELGRLADAGLYRPITATQFADPDLLDLAVDVLAHLCEAVPTEQLIPAQPENRFEPLRLPADRWKRTLSRPPRSPLEVGTELLRRGLAHRDSEARDGLRISSVVQTILFSAVAHEIAWQRWEEGGRAPDDALYPYTDSREADRVATQHWEKRAEASQPRKKSAGLGRSRYVYPETFAPCWKIDVGALLPVPRDDVALADLVEFRARHDTERQRLTRAVDHMLHELQRNPDHPKDAFRTAKPDLESALTDFEAAGRGRGITWARRSVVATVAAPDTGLRFPPGSAIPLGLVSGIAVNALTDAVRSLRRRPAVDISYLAPLDPALDL